METDLANRLSAIGLKILEAIAVVFSFLYTWLLASGNMWCWWFAILASVIYMYLCYIKGIYAEFLLHIFYLIMAFYGLSGSERFLKSGAEEPFSAMIHFLVIAVLGSMVYFSGKYLSLINGAKQVYLDAFTTIFSIWATFLMVNYFPENWLYWIVIDLASVVLYWRLNLYFTSGLYLAYTILAVRGWILWT
ncbi:nicotinamide riboside transporter PnuC [Schleiferia thermophila]|uniref:Nicotinamide riboside transporter PnuC n=1 Tax=Schleiferia thermophila TaxID=884107 RepID=A0A369A8H8_9FLAO|nr:nicotinamide riboside transporter PnuC [Schleiferia thermophila]RCX05445.1 nicotinamide mononucleotide transporter [Schleiferia thermophila]